MWAILSETGIFPWWFTVLISIKKDNDNGKKKSDCKGKSGNKPLMTFSLFQVNFS